MNSSLLSRLTLASLLTAAAALATPIVNLDATSNTASTATISLGAGTYQVTWAGISGGGLYDGWNTSANPGTNNLWSDRYSIDICGGTCSVQIVQNGNPQYSTANAALVAYRASTTLVSYNGSVNTPTPNPYTFTLTSTKNVIFTVPDVGSYGDDSGGLSLQVTQVSATPEPGTFYLSAGLLGLGIVFRRRLSGCVAAR